MARHMGTPDHHVRIGHRVAETIDAMVRQGLVPDVVVGHIGWGSMMFLKDVLPQVPALGYCEFFYRSQGADVGFAPDDQADLETRKRLRLRNIAQLLSLEAIEAGISPTHWQRSLYPADAQGRISVCHEGRRYGAVSTRSDNFGHAFGRTCSRGWWFSHCHLCRARS
jgi:hypothetical protein